LRRRQAARVVITGHGRLGASIAVALAEAGVGHVVPDVAGVVHHDELAAGPLRGSDVDKPRHRAIADAMTVIAPGVTTNRLRRIPPSLIIQLDHDEPAALVAASHGGRRLPHLVVTIREGTAVIGPLVPPAGGPCLACLDLHRLDRDADWPGLPRPVTPEPCTVTTLLAATAYATAEALAYLDGDTPETLGASIEITAPGRFRRRTWPPHPHCDCTRRRLPRQRAAARRRSGGEGT
jgi:bacteriocin biosynthesis cyclodehydratase domain-containing protein